MSWKGISMSRLWRLLRSEQIRRERGATIVVVAVAMSALFGLLALVLDLGMLYVAHEDAQRAADAAALAGASAFLNYAANKADAPARQRALEYALRNTFQNRPIAFERMRRMHNGSWDTITVPMG